MHPQVTNLLKIPQPVQKSPEWFKLRENKVTASSAASLLLKNKELCLNYVKKYNLPESFIDNKSANPYSSKKDYILTKCGVNKFEGNIATYWGNMLEDVAISVYEKKTKKEVLEFGLLPHPDKDFLAASPDGIRHDGVMLEIKCPYRRVITGIPPFYYYIQMMLQLDVCKLDYCDFLECTFKECNETTYNQLTEGCEVYNDNSEVKGIIVEIKKKGDRIRETSKFFYPPKEIINGNFSSLEEWSTDIIHSKQKSLKQDEIIRKVYWKCMKYSVVTVEKDQEMLDYMTEELRKGWEEVSKYKNNKDKLQELINTGKTITINTDNPLIVDIQDAMIVKKGVCHIDSDSD